MVVEGIDGELDGELEVRVEGESNLHELMLGKEVLILDFNGTVESECGRYNVRKFLKYCKKNGVKIAISTDSTRKSVENTPVGRLIMHYVDAFFGYHYPRHIMMLPKTDSNESAFEGVTLKNLELVINHFKVNPENALMITDSKADEFSAKAFGMNCYRLEDPYSPFDFLNFVPPDKRRKH